jgi:pimeloyl-ACP methyl ester carboxylesterase
MQGRIVRTFTSDNLNLQGMHCAPREPGPGRLVLHVHGSYGNFYENLFLDAMAAAYTSTGVAFLTVNTRGHDYYADFKMKRAGGGYDERRIGGFLERFEECLLDIKAWIDFASGEGCGSVLLQGHSLGAMKAAFYCARGNDARVRALLLVSPPGLLGGDIEQVRKRIEPNLAVARALAARNPDALMPEGSHFAPISAAAYLSLYSNLDIAGMFNLESGDTIPDRNVSGHSASGDTIPNRSGSGHVPGAADNPILAEIRVPVYAVIGSEDEYSARDPEQGFRLLKRAFRSAPSFTSKVIAGANHVYDDFENEVSDTLAEWAKG